MGVSWSFSGSFAIEREPDKVVIRSQWGNLIGSIFISAAFITGIIWIGASNGMRLSDFWNGMRASDPWAWIVFNGLILLGLVIMVPRRLTTSFECKTRKAVRVYKFAFGLITRRREIFFDDIACVAVQDYKDDGETLSALAFKRKSGEITPLAIRGASRDEALRAAQTISSVTGIALDAA